MILWSLDAFRACEAIAGIVVACPPGHAGELGEGVTVLDGGETRAESVLNALAVVETELVAIHDAARPLLTPGLIDELLDALAADPEAAGAIAAAPVTDTIKLARAQERPSAHGPASTPRLGESSRRSSSYTEDNHRLVETTLARSRLWAAQTPQVFRVEALREALEAAGGRRAEATDESSLVEAAGGRVLIHPSPPENLKVTTPLDLRVAELLLGERAP